MDRERTFVIPDEVCHKAGLSANWHSCNKFSVHAYRPVTRRMPDKKSTFAPCKAMVHHVRFDVMLFHPVTRKLINESNGTFLAGQKLIAKAGGVDIRGDLLKLSRQYR
jgi:nuclear pore complex protein Nup85